MPSFPDRRHPNKTTQTALDFLSSDPERLLTVTHNQDMRSSELLEMTSREMGLSAEQYLVRLRDPKEWGGGLEIVALANALERPIFLYELKPVGILFWSRQVNDDDDHIHHVRSL